jgi:hypothetical protein
MAIDRLHIFAIGAPNIIKGHYRLGPIVRQERSIQQ